MNKGSKSTFAYESLPLKGHFGQRHIYAFVLHSVERRIKCCKGMFQLQMDSRVHCQISVPRT